MKSKIIRSNRKTLAIQVRDGEVIVRAPYSLDTLTIQSFVKSKESWIQKNLDSYTPMGYQYQQQLKVFGNLYDTQIVEGKPFGVAMTHSVVRITVPHGKDKEWIAKHVDDHFKVLLNSYIQSRLPVIARSIQVEVPNYKIRRYKRIHGRCASRGDLAFNLYLYHESYEFIDYVILHECAHLIEFNHSKRFYNIIEQVMPNYKQIIKQK